MCDFTGRLIAWMDGELAENESAVMDQHVHTCKGCQGRAAAYEAVSRSFALYCDAVLEATTATPNTTIISRRKMPRWVPILAGAAAAAVLLLALLPRSVKPMPVVPQAAEARPPVAMQIATQSLKSVRHRHIAAHRNVPSANWTMAETAIQIAIPGDAMFPPGAVPAGVSYLANLSLAADGSVQGLHLQP